MGPERTGFLERRGAAVLLLVLFVAGALVFVFAGTLARATELETEAEVARSEVLQLQARVDAGNAELEYLETDTYVQQAARGVGYGDEGEVPFRLPADAPEALPLPPLGPSPGETIDQAPLEAWMQLLFGS